MATNSDAEKATTIMEEEVGKPLNHVEGNALLFDKHGNVRNVPVPSDDPNDPLNFSVWKKSALIFACCWFSVMSLALAGGLGAILGIFFGLYGPQGYGPSDIAFLLTVPSMCIGLGNFIIMPLALAFGRRPVFIVSSIVLLGSTIGSAAQHSYGAHLGTRIIQGLSAGASESLLPLILTELTFIHQRGKIFGLYWTSQSVISSVMNVSSSYEADALGWRWYYWVFAITAGIGVLLAIFFGFETQFHRPVTHLDGLVIITDEFGVTQIVSDNEAQDYVDQVASTSPAIDSEQSLKPYSAMLRPWSKPQPSPWKVITTCWLRMLQSLTSPAILYVVLASSITLGCVVGTSLTYDAILQSYGWHSRSIGLINVAGIVGCLLGAAYSSYAGEWLTFRMAKMNHGIHKPEHRLVVLILPALIGFAMLILYGATAEVAASGGGSDWSIVCSYALFQTTFISVLIVSTTFAAEASPKYPGPALVVVVGTKNIVSFGVAQATPSMIGHGGYKWTFGVLAGIFGALFILGIPVYFLNPRWRRFVSAKKYHH